MTRYTEATPPPQSQSSSTETEEEVMRMETEVREVMPRVERKHDEVKEELREEVEEEEDNGGGGPDMETETEEEIEEEEEEDVGGDGADTEEDDCGGSETETDNTGTETETERCIVMHIVWNRSIEDYEEKGRVADPDHLQRFALDELQSIPLANLVLDAIIFEKIYHSQKFWFCHFCGSYFSDGDSLTMHLKVEHIPSIAKCQPWLSLHKQDREFVQGSISKMVWKPIDVELAIRKFYKTCLDARSLEVEVWELPWPWSDHDRRRSKLLSQLEQVLKELTSDENGLSFLSSGPLCHLIAVASRHILVRLTRRDLVLDFTRQLASSPLSFCFLEEESLVQFVRVAWQMRNIVRKFSALDECNSTTCNMSSDSSINYKLSFQLSGKIYIILGPANCLDQKLSDIPCTGPLQLPSEPPKILSKYLAQLDLCSDLHCNLIMEEQFGLGYTVYDHISTKLSHQGLLRSHEFPFKTERSDFKNSLNWRPPVNYLEKMRYLSQADKHGLEFVEEICMLQSLEFEVRRLCIFDFRSYIVPLMQRFLKRWSSLSLKEAKFAAGFGCSDNRGGSFAGQTPSNAFKHANKDVYHHNTTSLPIAIAGSGKTQETNNSNIISTCGGGSCNQTLSSAFKHMNKEYHPNNSLPIAGCGDKETDNSGIFICVKVGAIVDDIDFYFEMADDFREAIYYLRIHKTWRYWYCYYCRKRFLNRESHMKHMDDIHKLNLPCDEQSRLVPRSPSKHEVDQLLGVKRKTLSSSFLEPLDKCHERAILERMKKLLYCVLEDETVPFSGSHLVHLAEFARDEFIHSDEEQLTVAWRTYETSVLNFSMYNTCCLQSVEKFLENLCKQCTPVEMQTHESTYIPDIASCGIFCAGPNLIFDAAKFSKAFSQAKRAVKERHPFILNYKSFKQVEKGLIIELDTLKGHFDEKHKVLGELDVLFALDHMLIRSSAYAETLGSLYKNQLISHLLSECSSLSIEEAVRKVKGKLLSKLGNLDVKIMQELARINKLKREMSDLCFWDYRTDILPVIGVFLKPRIRVDGDLTPWASNKLQELLHSIDRPSITFKSFRITSVSIGEVFVNIRDKWGLGFGYKKMRLNFEGEWRSVLRRDRYDGYVDFVGSSDWYGRKNEDMKAEATVVFTSGKILVDELVLAPLFRKAICVKLLIFQEAFVERNDVCITSHNSLSDCLRDVGWEYCCLDERQRQKKRFSNLEWDSSSSDEDTGGTPRTAMSSAVDHAGKVIGDGEDLLGT